MLYYAVHMCHEMVYFCIIYEMFINNTKSSHAE